MNITNIEKQLRSVFKTMSKKIEIVVLKSNCTDHLFFACNICHFGNCRLTLTSSKHNRVHCAVVLFFDRRNVQVNFPCVHPATDNFESSSSTTQVQRKTNYHHRVREDSGCLEPSECTLRARSLFV